MREDYFIITNLFFDSAKHGEVGIERVDEVLSLPVCFDQYFWFNWIRE